MKKTCIGCNKDKPEAEFRWKIKAKNIRIPRCAKCDREYRARYYRNNLVKFRESNKRAGESRKKKIEEGGIKEGTKKKCGACGKVRSVNLFRWKNKSEGLHISRCRGCDTGHRKEIYLENKPKYLENNKRQYLKLRKILEEHKDKPCADCGEKYPACVMDFDHIDPSTKVERVAAMASRGSERLLLEEIAKCEVVCSNCHRIRTHQQRETNHGQ